MRKIEQLWQLLEHDSIASSSPFLMRGYGSEGHEAMYVAWNKSVHMPALAVHMGKEYETLFRNLEEHRDFTLSVQQVPGSGIYLLLQLKSVEHKEIFAALAEDLVVSASSIQNEQDLVKALINRLHQWETLFSRVGTQGLTPEAQRGLYGELLFLQHLFRHVLDYYSCVESWVGPLAAVQDFQKGLLAIEVKTTYSKAHHRIHVSSNRQLDDRGLDALYLYHVALDIRPNGPDTLNALIANLEELLQANQPALNLFRLRLAVGGYIEGQSNLYDSICYGIREEAAYRVIGDFPRITEAQTPTGVGDLTYTIIASSCAPWRINLMDIFYHY